MCQSCDWEDAAYRARRVSEDQPAWKNRSSEFFLSLSDSIESSHHVTTRQIEVIEQGEAELED
jgi:hypothetical protein